MNNIFLTARLKALAAIILCVLFWGFSFISIKITLTVFPPMSLGMLRFAMALVFLYFVKQKLAPEEKLNPKDIPLLSAAGLFGVTIYFFCENNGVALVSASEASIAIGSIPVLTMLADYLETKIRTKLNKVAHNKHEDGVISSVRLWVGAFISIAGVWLVAGVSFAVSGSVLGYIFMTGAAVSWVLYSFLTRSLFARCSRIYIVFWQTLAGFIGFIPFSIMELKDWGTSNAEVIIHLLFLGICCSAMGYLLYVHALKNLGISICSIFINLIPVVTVIAGFFMLGDRLDILQWLGAALVITGVYLAMWKSKNGDRQIGK